VIEVEAKVKVNDLKYVREVTRNISHYVEKQKKIDDYYTLENLKGYPTKSLRIRKIKDKYIVNFKQRISYDGGVHAKKEVEFETTDINGFLGLIKDFGFKKWLRKEKQTELYEIKDNFHIEINNVKKLGWFLEIEYLTDKKGVNKARREVGGVLKKLAVKKEDIVKDGYTKMLWDLMH